MNRIFLSRRNLQTLLNKLDRRATGEETAATIIKYRNVADPEEYMQTLDQFAIIGVETIDGDLEIHAVEDADYYRDRGAGAMLPVDDPSFKETKWPF